MKRKYLYLLSSLIVVSCKTVKPEATVKHTLGDVSWSDGRWTYLELDRASFIHMNNSSYLPESHVLSVKATEWVRRLHAAVIATYPQKMANIPHPQIIVMKKSSPDAFAARKRNVSYKVNVKLSLENVPNEVPKQTNPLYFNTSNNALAHNIFPPEITVPISNALDYATWFTKIHYPCSLETTGNTEVPLAYGAQCALESYLKLSDYSAEFVTQAAPNWLIVTSGLFAVLPSEESFAAVIAHELAHYYRAHVVKDVKHYNHCYRLNDPEHKPVIEQELQGLCRDLKAGRSRGGVDAALAATKVGLGVYTIEEEADELALELLTLAGIQPMKATEAWFALFERADHSVTQTEVPLARCKELFKNNWKDQNGNTVAIPVGDYQDTHHSWCFRVFNTTNEIAIHGYSVKRPLELDPIDWLEMAALGRNP